MVVSVYVVVHMSAGVGAPGGGGFGDGGGDGGGGRGDGGGGGGFGEGGGLAGVYVSTLMAALDWQDVGPYRQYPQLLHAQHEPSARTAITLRDAAMARVSQASWFRTVPAPPLAKVAPFHPYGTAAALLFTSAKHPTAFQNAGGGGSGGLGGGFGGGSGDGEGGGGGGRGAGGGGRGGGAGGTGGGGDGGDGGGGDGGGGDTASMRVTVTYPAPRVAALRTVALAGAAAKLVPPLTHTAEVPQYPTIMLAGPDTPKLIHVPSPPPAPPPPPPRGTMNTLL